MNIYAIVMSILVIVGTWKMFGKAIIPLYNDYTMFKLTWKPAWFWIFLVTTIAWSIVSFLFIEEAYEVTLPDATIDSYAIVGLLLAFFLASVIFLMLYIAFLYHIAKTYTKRPVLYTILLTLLPGIGYLIIGAGKNYEYRKEESEPESELKLTNE